MKHTIFISYRREGGFETAKMIQENLKTSGYKVFLDYEELRYGKFNEQLYAKIEECKDFIVICSPDCFERCEKKDDWLRLEIEYALKHNKNIVPVLLRNFEWPKNMPSGMGELSLMQGVASSEELFDAFSKKLQSYLKLKSKFHLKHKGILITTFIALLLVVSSLFYYLHYKAQKQIEQVSTTIVSDITTKLSRINVELLNKDEVYKRWKKFYHTTPRLNENKYLLQRDELINYLDYRVSQVDTTSYNILNTHYLDIMSESDVPLEDLQIFYSMAYQMNLQEVISYYRFVKQWVETPPAGWLDQMEEIMQTRINMIEYSTLNMYFAILEMFSYMPEESLESFFELSAELTAFPDIETITRENANARAEKYMRKFEQSVMEFGELTGQAQRDLDLQEKQVEKLQLQHENIALREENKKIKEEKVEQMREELALKEVELADAYDEVRKKCKPTPDDDPWLVWGKMIRLLAVKLKPEALENLDYFENMNTEEAIGAKAYTVPTRKFISNELFTNYDGGVVVFGFKDNVPHSSLKTGDIIVAVNEKPVINDSDFLNLRKQEGATSVLRVLRLNGENFNTLNLKAIDTDPLIGVSSLMEKRN